MLLRTFVNNDGVEDDKVNIFVFLIYIRMCACTIMQKKSSIQTLKQIFSDVNSMRSKRSRVRVFDMCDVFFLRFTNINAL